MRKSSNMIYPDNTPGVGYSTIGNEVLEKVASDEFTRAERIVLTRIMEDTIAWEKDRNFINESIRRITYDISMERFIEKTGLSEQEITPALDNLEERHIIERDGDSITFNYHVKEWI